MARPRKKTKIEKILEKLPLEKRHGRQSIAPKLSFDFNKGTYYFFTGKKENSIGKQTSSYFTTKSPEEMEQFIQDFDKLDTKKSRQNSAMHTKESVSDYLKEFIINQKYDVIATQLYYEGCKKRICKIIGAIELYDLSTDDCDCYINEQLKVYSSETVKKDFDFLSMALKKAYASRKIQYNPILACVPPKSKKNQLTDLTKEIKYYSADDANKIIEWAKSNLYKDNKYHNEDRNNVYARSALLAIFTGMRREEVCGLKFEDLFLDETPPCAHIQRARTELCNGLETKEYATKSTKNKSSDGYIALAPEVVELLSFIKKEYEQNQQEIKDFTDSQFVICYSNGTIPNPSALSMQLSKHLKNIGLSEVLDFKALRHTFATLSRDGGEVTPFELQAQMRHTSISTTEKYYLGKSKHVKPNAVGSFSKMLQEAKNKGNV